jgi:hypothetical protein
MDEDDVSGDDEVDPVDFLLITFRADLDTNLVSLEKEKRFEVDDGVSWSFLFETGVSKLDLVWHFGVRQFSLSSSSVFNLRPFEIFTRKNQD